MADNGPTACGHVRARRWVLVVGTTCLFPVAAAVQTEHPKPEIPRTRSGVPDLSGYWAYGSATPLERPTSVGDKAVLTPEEASRFLAERYANIARTRDLQLNADWWVPGELTAGRTSLIVDPPHGRLPARSAAAADRMATLGLALRLRPADGPEDRERYERCIMGRSIPMEARPPPRLMQIFQTEDHVAILNEQKSELRLVPLVSRSRLSDAIRSWRGDGRGRWHEDTLVVETTNFNGKWTFYGTGRNMTLVERFAFRDSDTLRYEVTITDPESFAAPWTLRFPVTRAAGPLYENACHEGNYSMPLILRGARADDAEAGP